jgi:plastocyanin
MWAVLVVCVIAGLFLVFEFTRTPAASEQAQANAEPPGRGVTGNANTKDPFDVTITYTANGFSPADTTIKRGERVRFVNNSNEETWPASGIHPTHTLYPEKEKTDCLGSSFDACIGLKQGEFFDFTFNYIGEWRFHDHLHPYNTGSVTVTE